MPLNLTVGDGDFTPYLKYNAKAGRFYIRLEGDSEDVEIHNPTLVFDMANIKTGWIYYAEGSGPEKVWDPSPTQMAPKPHDPRKKFKRGFEVMVYGNSTIQQSGQKIGLREFSSSAASVIGPLLRMYAEYEEGAQVNKGSVPIYEMDGSPKPINGAYGVNYEPRFKLKGWVPRGRVPAFDEHLLARPEKPKQSNGDYNENPADGFSDDIPF